MSKTSDIAYAEIRAAILAGKLSPGTHLRERELAESMGISRTPVRDAIRRLAAEYWVRVEANRGAFVCDWSPEDFAEIFELGALLESHAARRAASRISPDEIQALEAVCDQLDAVVSVTDGIDAEEFARLNYPFHEIIRRAAGSDRLKTMLALLVEQRVVLVTAASYKRAAFIRSQEHHRELVEALKARDGDWAASVMRSHVWAAYHWFEHTGPPRKS